MKNPELGWVAYYRAPIEPQPTREALMDLIRNLYFDEPVVIIEKLDEQRPERVVLALED